MPTGWFLSHMIDVYLHVEMFIYINGFMTKAYDMRDPALLKVYTHTPAYSGCLLYRNLSLHEEHTVGIGTEC